MSIVEEAVALRRELALLAKRPEWDLLMCYELRKPPRSTVERITRVAKRVLAAVGMWRPHLPTYPWLPTLRHASAAAEAKILLIWGVGLERDGLRRACEGFLARLRANSGLVPVLVTDVTDFAYFSRLGWLVEYLPELSGEGQSYQTRKRRYLAWRYRDAMVVPISAGLASDTEWKELMEADAG